MPQAAFLSALKKVTEGAFTLSDAITAADSLTAAGQPDLAEQLYKVWITYNPENPLRYVANFNCAALQTRTGDLAGATLSLNAAIAQSPDFLPAYINLGGVLEKTGQPNQALDLWRAGVDRLAAVTGTAVGYKVSSLKQMARVFSDHKQVESAEAALHQCLSLQPGEKDALEQYAAFRLEQCKWPVAAPFEGVDRKAIVGGMHPLSLAAYTDDPLLQLASASRYVERSVEERPEILHADRRHAATDLTGRRLKVGYVSSDLRDHAVGYLMAELFELHDREAVEVFAYYCGKASTEALTLRTQAAVEHWLDIREMSDDEAARRIAADGVDILVDVNGHTRDARPGVFARRPAPIQVNWLGYPGTMGSPYHHYIIADPWIVPPELEHYYSEAVVRLPCYQPNDRKRIVAEQGQTRAEAGLPEGAFVFCCFNGTQKITRFMFDRWIEILTRTPDSVLWLLDCAPATRERLTAYAAERGISAERFVFAPKMANPNHLARYPLADLFLDTTPYGAHTTASDALWMGVPVLTLSGRTFASRVCGSLVRSAGVPELVCETPEAYVERAVALAGSERAHLLDLRARLQAGRDTCVLFDVPGLVAAVEAIYRDLCADRQAGRLPQPDLTNLDAYFAAGLDHDHEGIEVLAQTNYETLFKARLADRDRLRSLAEDPRLWAPEPAPAEKSRKRA
jgi:predicted O-linked N-acetylglucosamine transferase (SPINDLY family)